VVGAVDAFASDLELIGDASDKEGSRITVFFCISGV
jgi:hypothetical protein